MAWELPPHPANNVRTREDLAAFIVKLRDDFTARGQEWENPTLDRYLDALAAWVDSADGWYRNFDQDMPEEGNWVFFARALSAAVIYE